MLKPKAEPKPSPWLLSCLMCKNAPAIKPACPMCATCFRKAQQAHNESQPSFGEHDDDFRDPFQPSPAVDEHGTFPSSSSPEAEQPAPAASFPRKENGEKQLEFRNLPSCLSCGQRVRRPNHLRCQSCLDKIRDQTEYVRKSSVERMIRNAMPAAGGAKRISPDNSEDVQADRSILNFNRKIAYTYSRRDPSPTDHRRPRTAGAPSKRTRFTKEPLIPLLVGVAAASEYAALSSS
jgi:hypothetical protein